MSQQRILKEAQAIASKYSFWMVSGDISHLYGFVLKTPEITYELEIKFGEKFPNTPPKLIFHDKIKELLGNVQLKTVNEWKEESNVIDIIDELKSKIENSSEGEPEQLTSNKTVKREDNLIPQASSSDESSDKEEYITPDLNAYPPEFHFDGDSSTSSSGDDLFFMGEDNKSNETTSDYSNPHQDEQIPENAVTSPNELFLNSKGPSVQIMTELSLIQQEYAYDQKGKNQG
ncbi:MAG: hypothetical protein EU549_02900, partial [Promethearchaeota archaeon]